MSVAIKFTEKYYTTSEAAEELGVTRDTVKNYCNGDSPRIRAEKVGSSWMIPLSEIKRYKEQESSTGRPKNISR